MIKRNSAIPYMPIGVFIKTADGSEVMTGTPVGTYSKDGTAGALSGTIAYNNTVGSWGITGITATETDGDIVEMKFALSACLPIHKTFPTTTKTIVDLKDASAAPTASANRIEMDSNSTKLALVDAAISTRSTFAGGLVAGVTAPVTVGTNNDKTGYALATAPPTAASIAALILVTPAQKIVTDGTGRVTVGTNADKGGYSLTSLPAIPTNWLTAAGLASDAVAEIQSGLSTYAGGDTAGTTTLLTRITAAVALASQIPANLTDATFASAGVFSAGSLVNAPTGSGGGSGATPAQISDYMDANSVKLANLDVASSTRMATFTYIAPDNTSIGAIKVKTDNLPTNPAATGDAMALTSGERTTLVAAVFAFVTEGTTTFVQAIRGISSSAMAKVSGMETGTPAFRDLADGKNRINATTDSDGNRTSVTRDLT